MPSSSSVTTESGPHTETPLQSCCRNSELPERALVVAAKSSTAETNVRSLSSVGRSTSEVVLPAGDLIGRHRSGHCFNDTYVH